MKDKKKDGRETYRAALAERVKEKHGDINTVAKATGLGPATVYRQLTIPGTKTPESYALLKIAEAKGVSPAWLAYGIGPRDVDAAAHGFDMGAFLEAHPEAYAMLATWAHANEKDRALLEGMAAKMQPAGDGEEARPNLPPADGSASMPAKLPPALTAVVRRLMVLEGHPDASDEMKDAVARAAALLTQQVRRADTATPKDRPREGPATRSKGQSKTASAPSPRARS